MLLTLLKVCHRVLNNWIKQYHPIQLKFIAKYYIFWKNLHLVLKFQKILNCSSINSKSITIFAQFQRKINSHKVVKFEQFNWRKIQLDVSPFLNLDNFKNQTKPDNNWILWTKKTSFQQVLTIVILIQPSSTKTNQITMYEQFSRLELWMNWVISTRIQLKQVVSTNFHNWKDTT